MQFGVRCFVCASRLLQQTNTHQPRPPAATQKNAPSPPRQRAAALHRSGCRRARGSHPATRTGSRRRAGWRCPRRGGACSCDCVALSCFGSWVSTSGERAGRTVGAVADRETQTRGRSSGGKRALVVRAVGQQRPCAQSASARRTTARRPPGRCRRAPRRPPPSGPPRRRRAGSHRGAARRRRRRRAPWFGVHLGGGGG